MQSCRMPTVPQHSRTVALKHRPFLVAAAGKGFGTKPKPKPKPSTPTAPIVDPCPCQSGKNYKNCCQKVHDGDAVAATPEAALRARFSAFVRNKQEYIIRSTHPDYFPYHYEKPASDAEAQQKYASDVEKGCTKFTYTDLKVVEREPENVGPDDLQGFVGFCYKSAPMPEEGQAVPEEAWSMTNEKCRFQRVNGQWLFTDYQTYTNNLSHLLSQVQQEPQAA